MTFSTPNGTRGAQQPTLEQMQAMNQRAIANIRNGGSAFPGMDSLVLITIGAKSGQVRENPVAYFAQPDGAWLVVASAAGAAKHPAWYHNLAAHPDQVRIIVAGTEHQVHAEPVTGAERDQLWSQITAASAGFASYEKLTDRLIPLIRLRPTQN